MQNDVELTNVLLEALRLKAIAAGFGFLSTLIEDHVRETGPPWLRNAAVLAHIDNYLGSGIAFDYLQTALSSTVEN